MSGGVLRWTARARTDERRHGHALHRHRRRREVQDHRSVHDQHASCAGRLPDRSRAPVARGSTTTPSSAPSPGSPRIILSGRRPQRHPQREHHHDPRSRSTAKPALDTPHRRHRRRTPRRRHRRRPLHRRSRQRHDQRPQRGRRHAVQLRREHRRQRHGQRATSHRTTPSPRAPATARSSTSCSRIVWPSPGLSGAPFRPGLDLHQAARA